METSNHGLHLHRILACSDGSPESAWAWQAALELARRVGSEVYCLEVLEFNPGFTGLAPEFVGQWENEVQARLDAVREEASRQGVDLQTMMRQGEAAHAAIVEEAEKLQAGLIVMGRHGRGGLARLLMGSVTARVIGHSPCPVLVVPGEAPLNFGRLLVASDGSPDSEEAWGAALELAGRFDSAVQMVCCAREEGEIAEAEAIARRLLEDANRHGLFLETRVMVGQPDDVIVQTALKQRSDLIIMGSHGRTGWRRLLMGSVTERVIGQAPCVVLVVRGQ